MSLKDPSACNCCEAYQFGLMAHSLGSYNDAISYYEKALTGEGHKLAERFASWARKGWPQSSSFDAKRYDDHGYVRSLHEIFRNNNKIGDPDIQLITILSELARYSGKKIAASWHSIRIVADANVLGYTEGDVRKSVGQIGPLHNDLDSEGCLIAGSFRPQSPTDSKGWTEVSAVRFLSGKATIIGTKAKHIPALVTYDDIDVALILAFADPTGSVRPSFSLEPSCSTQDDLRFDRKEFNPPWLGNTDFGKSMFFADWLMKGMTMQDGLPSVLHPDRSEGVKSSPSIHPLVEAIANAGGDMMLPDGTKADAGRLELVINGVKLAACKKSRWFRDESTYVIKGFNHKIESSLIRRRPGQPEDRTLRSNDPTTTPGAAAKIIQDNYDEAAKQYPVFHRVRLLLSLYSLFSQARLDGVKLSGAETDRLHIIQSRHKHGVEKLCPLSPKPFHRGGCNCNGGVSGRPYGEVERVSQRPLLIEDHTKDRFKILDDEGKKISHAGYVIQPNLNKVGDTYTSAGSLHHTVYFGANIEGMRSIRLSWDVVDGKRVRMHMTDLEPFDSDGNIIKKRQKVNFPDD